MSLSDVISQHVDGGLNTDGNMQDFPALAPSPNMLTEKGRRRTLCPVDTSLQGHISDAPLLLGASSSSSGKDRRSEFPIVIDFAQGFQNGALHVAGAVQNGALHVAVAEHVAAGAVQRLHEHVAAGAVQRLHGGSSTSARPFSTVAALPASNKSSGLFPIMGMNNTLHPGKHSLNPIQGSHAKDARYDPMLKNPIFESSPQGSPMNSPRTENKKSIAVVYNKEELDIWHKYLLEKVIIGLFHGPRPPVEVLKHWMRVSWERVPLHLHLTIQMLLAS